MRKYLVKPISVRPTDHVPIINVLRSASYMHVTLYSIHRICIFVQALYYRV